MNRRRWIAAGTGVAIGGLSGRLVAVPSRPTFGVLSGGNADFAQRWVVDRLTEVGWVDGRTATIVARNGSTPELPALATEIAARRPDLVIAVLDSSIRAAAGALPNVPIVMASALDPVGNGWVKSLREPGGRFTGTAWTQDPAMTGKYVEILAEAVPGMRRIGGLIDPTFTGIDIYRTAFEAAAVRLGLDPIHVPLSAPEALPAAMQALTASRVQAMFVYGSWVSSLAAPAIASAAASARLPACYMRRQSVEAGGLMSYGPSIQDLCRRAVDIADRILRGESPARIPIEQPSRYEFIVNLRAAAAIGLKLPPALLARADGVLE